MFKAMMKKAKLILTLAILAGLSLQSTFAQDAVTDEELSQYATVMYKADSLGENVKATFNDLVKSHELMDGGRNYMSLEGTKGDSTKIAELGLSPETLAAYDEIKDTYAKLQDDYKAEYTRMVKEDLGVAVYNKVRGAMKSDTDLKAKYEALLASMQPKSSDEDLADDGSN